MKRSRRKSKYSKRYENVQDNDFDFETLTKGDGFIIGPHDWKKKYVSKKVAIEETQKLRDSSNHYGSHVMGHIIDSSQKDAHSWIITRARRASDKYFHKCNYGDFGIYLGTVRIIDDFKNGKYDSRVARKKHYFLVNNKTIYFSKTNLSNIIPL